MKNQLFTVKVFTSYPDIDAANGVVSKMQVFTCNRFDQVKFKGFDLISLRCANGGDEDMEIPLVEGRTLQHLFADQLPEGQRPENPKPIGGKLSLYEHLLKGYPETFSYAYKIVIENLAGKTTQVFTLRDIEAPPEPDSDDDKTPPK